MDLVSSIIAQAKANDIVLYVDEGKLGYIAEKGGLPDELKTLLVAHKPAVVAYLVNEQIEAEKHKQTPTIPKRPALERLELSYTQQRLWFIDQMQGGTPQYNIFTALQIEGNFDVALAEQALRQIIERHEILRTRYGKDENGPLQIVVDDFDFSLSRIDLQSRTDAQQKVRVGEIVEADAAKAFDLAYDLVLRAMFIQQSATKGVLVLNVHHIASDGWSMAVLTDEFNHHYHALKTGKPVDLAPLTIQYADYAHWQRNSLSQQDIAGQLQYWQQQLEGIPQAHSLPLDHPRPEHQSVNGELHHHTIGQSLYAGLNRLAVANDATEFMLLHSAFSLLIARHSNNPDVVIGIPVANRARDEFKPMLGFFVNTLILRINTGENVSFKDFLATAKAVNLDAQSNQDVPFEQLVDTARPERSTQYSPLFQIAFNLDQISAGSSDAMSDLTITPISKEHVSAKFELMLNATQIGNGMRFSFEYNKDLFDADTIAALATHFEALLSDIVANPAKPIHRLELFSAEQKQALLHDNANAKTLPAVGNLVELFAKQVESSADAIALNDDTATLSYGELNAKANRLAHHLIAQGVTGDTLVGLSVPRSLDMVVGILAILKAGGAYVPLDPAYPQERLAYMMQDSKLKLLLAHSDIDALPVIDGIERIDMDSIDCEGSLDCKDTATDPQITITPEQMAYVIYTSGSTGQPKGVMVEHGNVHRLLSACQNDFNFDASDVWCLFHSYAFDFSVWELWGALGFGGRLVVVPQWVSRSPQDFYQLVATQKVTVLNQTPTAFTQFNRVDAEQKADLALRAVVFGGEALNLSELRGWVNRHGDSAPMLVNMYGITETTVHVTYRRLMAQDIIDNKGSLIGHPLSDLTVYVLDSELQPAPLGTTGEMFVGGRGVSRGYLHNNELTDSRFINNPHKSGEKLYRTGDLACYLKSGELAYLGRIDEQVKIRGFRIELGEIEQQLSAQRLIDSSVVVLREDAEQVKQLVAYVKASEGIDLNGAEFISQVRNDLQGAMPIHMIPAVFVIVDGWPLTANGKVNKKALPEPDMSVLQARYVAPRSVYETLLCDIWQQVLKLDKVGIEDNFFNIGGDSILSIGIIAGLKKRGYELTVKQLFEYQTIAQLAVQLKALDSSIVAQVEPFAQLIDGEREQFDELYGQRIEEAYPLSNLQAGMVFHTQLGGFNGIYHDIMADHVKCRWDQAHFATALSAVIAAHPILRSGFTLTGERPLQHVFKHIETPLLVEDIRQQSEDTQTAYLQAWTDARKLHQFDWANGPLFQINIFLRSDESFEFVISFHHAILDGWSRAALSTELYNHYQQLLNGQTPVVTASEWIYRDFIALETENLQDESVAQHFEQMLENAPVQQVPYKAEADQGALRVQQTCLVDGFEGVSTKLIALAKAQGVPTQSVLLAVHFKVLALLSGEKQALSCVTHNGRPELEGAEKGLGLYLNSLPLSLELNPGSWTDLIAQVAHLSRENINHRRFPLAEIQKQLGREFGEVTFNYTHFHIYDNMTQSENQADGQSQFELLDSNIFEQTNFDFHVDISRTLVGDTMFMAIHYNANLYDTEQVSTIAQYYVKAFNLLLDSPAASHQQVSLLCDTQLQQIEALSGKALGKDSGKYAEVKTLPQQFTEQAVATPDFIAMKSPQGELTYVQLDELSNRLAAYLLEMDIKAGSRVGIHLPRGAAQLIGVLGTNKAGASYVPLEPGLPVERLLHMVKDAEIELVLLQSDLVNTLPLSGVDVLLMDDVMSADWLAEFADDYVPVAVMTIDEAYVLYTSGSTGLPKGVLINHASLSHYLSHAQSHYLPEHIKGSVVSSPLCFDATLTTLLTPLCVGKTVHLLADGDAALSELPNYLFDQQNSWLFKLTPAHLDALIYSGEQQQQCNSQHIIVVGGEQLRMTTLSQYKGQLLPQARFVNEYGPTETVVGTSVMNINSADDLAALAGNINVPIGKPIAQSQLFVVGSAGQLQPLNSMGELYIGGPGVGLGYANLDEQTQQSFSEYNGQRVYKTGDLARWLPTGELEFIGRSDHQVKIRGYRIELGEISEQLLSLACVKEAVVTALKQEKQEPELVAYVVVDDKAGDDIVGNSVAVCRGHLQTHLPEYMVPMHYVQLDSIPLTANGKVDTKALPAPNGEDQHIVEYVAPRTELEQQLCQIWSEVLNQPKVGIEDNFFSLGGDSILSIRVVSLLKRQDLFINIKDIFSHQSVAQLAAFVESEKLESEKLEGNSGQGSQTEQLLPFALLSEQEKALIDEAVVADAYPLSTLQAGMVFHSQKENFNGVYHDVNAEHIQCHWDEAHFSAALSACLAAHPILRTRFKLAGERPLQLVHKHVDLPLVVEDIRGQSQSAQEVYLSAWTEARKLHQFDWVNGPLYQINIFLRSDNSFEFVISFHHSVLDGWSRATFSTELYNHYQQLLNAQQVTTAKPEWIYRQYVALELGAIERGEAQSYFGKMLEEAPTRQLPLLNPVQTQADELTQGHHLVEGFEHHSAQMIALAKKLGVPMQVILLAVHYKALSTVSGQSHVMSCVVNNGRPEVEGGEQGLGLFLNSVPLALTLGEGSWLQLIEQIADANIQNLGHRHYPLANIQKDTELEFSEVLFNYTHFHVFGQMGNDNESQGIEVLASSGYEQTNFDFQVDVARGVGNDALFMSFKYDAKLFGKDMMETMAGYYLAALESLLSETDAKHSDAMIMDDVQTRFLLEGIHNLPAQLPEMGNLVQLFEAQVANNPAAVAVNFEDQQLSYGALNAKANQVAHLLVAQGVKADTLVGLSVPRSLDMVIGILAILKAGGAYVPLDPAYPADRLSYMMQNSGLKLLLSHRSINSLPLVDDIVRVDIDEQDVALNASINLNIEISAGQLAYVIYTSGSTGQPKGVMVEHGNVHRLLSACQQDFNFDASDVWCLFHSYAFDFSVWELWGALAFGGRLVVVPQWISRSPEDFYAMLSEQKVTVLNQTPTAFSQFNRVDEQQNAQLALKTVVFGGEALNLSELQGWVNRHGDAAPMLVNMYGITETTVHVTYRRLLAQDIAVNHGSLIGRALSDLKVYVLNSQLQVVPVGTSGEMFVGGRGVSRGYLGQAELTASRFIESPHCAGERLYRTGDLARYLPSGELEYQGRIDEQVKIRGFRIELGEIEQQLSAQTLIDTSVVIVREDDSSVKQLVAYIKIVKTAQAVNQADIDDAQLIVKVRADLQNNLPSHMVPAVFVVVQDWPLTANGKINKKALPEPDMSVLQAHFVEPRNATERLLCQIWQSSLKLDQVGIEDNFFNIGGDSILSIQIVAALKTHGYGLSVKQLFEHQTIGRLAEHLTVLDSSEIAPVEPFAQLTEQERGQFGDDIEEAYPLSNLQAGMVFHTQMSRSNGIYHDIMAEHIKCPWHHQHFETALAACIAKHPIMRSGFTLDGERPLQHVFKNIRTPLLVEDIRDQSKAVQDAYLAAWRDYHKQRQFNWADGPLFQINIFQRSDDSFEFVFSFHHAILDGWSRAALTTELYNHYEKLLSGKPVESQQPDWTYRDFIALEQAAVADKSAPAHFDKMLELAPVRQIPFKAGATKEAERLQQTVVVDDFVAVSPQLLALAKTQGVPVQSVLLAAHFKVLSLVSGESQAVSCVTHNGRPEQAGADKGLGLFLNSLPLSLDLSANSGKGHWTDLIADVAALGTKNLNYRRYPLSEIQKQVGREFEEVTFNYTHFHIYDTMGEDSDHSLELIGSESFEQTNFDYHVDISKALVGESMSMVIHYNANLYEGEQIEKMAAYYVTACNQLVAELDNEHQHSVLLASHEQAQLQSWSVKPQVNEVSALPMPLQFAQQAKATPQAVGVVAFDGELNGVELSYSALDELSTRLAAYLQDMDIAVGSRVGIYLPRSIAQMVAVLGINKAGASYVPLEPGLPQDRLVHMINDAEVELILLPKALMNNASLTGVDVLLMDDVMSVDWLIEFADAFEAVEIAGADEAYVLYTSGSTGRPKGVQICHDSLNHYLTHAKTEYLPAHITGSVVSSPLCFDATLTTLLTPLCAGKSVHLLADGKEALNQLPQYLFESEQNWLFKLTPAHLDALVFSAGEDNIGKNEHIIVVGGEQLRMATLNQYKGKLLPNARFVNEYGPTETVVGTSVFTVDTAEQLSALQGQVNVPIGQPIAGSSLFVVGTSGQLQPVNSVGELYIAGAGVGLGYCHLEAQTNERFVEFNGQRVYKTGDLVRWLPSGELEFVGRSDEQVKLRGYRIELGEISQQLLTLDAINEAVVTAHQAENETGLTAYMVAGDLDSADEAALIEQCRSHLLANLPDYMVPTAFVLLEEMPLTANGKVDTKALPAPSGHTAIEVEYIAPRNAIEQQLCVVWKQVMERDQVGRDDNFFSIGGDSILSIRMVTVLKQQGWQIDVTDIFEYPTIASLAKHALDNNLAQVDTVAEYKAQLAEEGKDIEEGSF